MVSYNGALTTLFRLAEYGVIPEIDENYLQTLGKCSNDVDTLARAYSAFYSSPNYEITKEYIEKFLFENYKFYCENFHVFAMYYILEHNAPYMRDERNNNYYHFSVFGEIPSKPSED
jgi:hypothetical protein